MASEIKPSLGSAVLQTFLEPGWCTVRPKSCSLPVICYLNVLNDSKLILNDRIGYHSDSFTINAELFRGSLNKKMVENVFLEARYLAV